MKERERNAKNWRKCYHALTDPRDDHQPFPNPCDYPLFLLEGFEVLFLAEVSGVLFQD
jgi:hypothetical protein